MFDNNLPAEWRKRQREEEGSFEASQSCIEEQRIHAFEGQFTPFPLPAARAKRTDAYRCRSLLFATEFEKGIITSVTFYPLSIY